MPAGYRFHCPVKIVSGESALDRLPGEFKQIGGSRPIVVTDSGVARAGLLDLIQKACEGSDLNLAAVYDQVPADAPVGAVLEIVEQYRQNECDCILAVGGARPLTRPRR